MLRQRPTGNPFPVRHSLETVRRIVLRLAAPAASVAALACGQSYSLSGPSPAPIPSPGSPVFQITVVPSSFTALAHCDTQNARDEGKFTFRVSLYDQARQLYTLFDLATPRAMKDGETVDLTGIVGYTRTIAPVPGNYFEVRLRATEWNTTVLGLLVRNGEMNERTGSAFHTFQDDEWTNRGFRSLTLTGSPTCSVRLNYTFDARRIG